MALAALKTVWNAGLQRFRGGGTRFAAYSVMCHLLNGASGLLAIRWLEPIALGWWNTSQLLRIPLDALRLGILNGMNRDYPFLIGANEPEKARQTLETGLAHTLAMVIVSQIVLGLVFFFIDRDRTFLFAGLLANSLVWSFGCYSQYVRSTLRTSQGFGLLGQVELGVAGVDSVGVLLVWRYGYYGLLARAVLSAVLTAGAFYRFQPVKVRPRWHIEPLLHMFRSGRHSFLIGYVLLIGSNAERLVLLTLNDGVKLLGLYTPAIVCASFLQIVPGAIHSYYYPQVVHAFGRDRDKAKLLATILQQIKRVSLMMVGLSAAAALGIFLLIKLFLPRYEGCLPAAVLISIAGPFFPLRMYASYYAALLHWREYYAFAVLQTTLPFAAMWALLPFFSPLTAVAIGYVVSVIASGGALFWFTLAHAKKGKEPTVQGVS